MLDPNRTVTIGRLVKLAHDLKCEDPPPAGAPCSEYDRALAELVTDAAGLSMEDKAEVARAIGIHGVCR